MTELRNLKGTRDYLPQEQRVRQEIIQKLRNVFEKYGYQPLDTPAVCYYDVLASKYAGGAEILKEVYKLNDQGGRGLGLRYDLTVPFARVMGMNPDIRLPFKRYEIGRVYRDGPVKTGRNREFIQCDVDVAGIGSMMAEAELMAMAVEIFGLLELDVYISYNNRKFLSGIVESVGITLELVPQVILALDKLEKTDEKVVEDEMSSIGIDRSKSELLLAYMKMRPDELLAFFPPGRRNYLLDQGKKEMEELDSYTEALGIKNSLRFTPGLARGLEIYTGTVWEVFLTDCSITSSIGAGGRYDEIIGAFLGNGIEYPAVGMTFGLDVIYTVLESKGLIPEKPPVDLYVIPVGTGVECMKIAAGLRRSGIRTDVDMTGRKLKKSLDYANKLNIPYVAVVGEDELASGKIKIKNMFDGSENEVSLEAPFERIKMLLA